MVKSIFNKKYYLLILIFTSIFLVGFHRLKQNSDIILQDEHLAISPAEFYVADVIDERDSHNAVALIIPAVNSKDAKAYPVDLHGGSLFAVKQYIDHSLPANKLLRPVVIGLKKFTVIETALAGSRVEGHVNLAMAFYLKRTDDESLHLADYTGTAVYNRMAGPPQQIEPTLRLVLKNSLLYLNTWMNRQADSNIKLAKGVKLTLTDYTEKTEGDSIYYAVNRPLTWNDFQSKTISNKFDAEVFPTIGYEEHNEITKGIISVKLAIKVCLPKSACWVKDGSRNSYVLNHEQRHFDIAKIAAEHFEQKLKAENLPVDNYDGPVNVDYLDAYREMNNLQKQYDDETHHGTNQAVQQQWNVRIDKELKEYGVK
jgi:hypothetical protein